MKAIEVYQGSDGAVTTAYYKDLEKLGPIGVVAMNLFRAQKCSARAKLYRGGIRGKGSYKSMAYERKAWSMEKLSEVLVEHGAKLAIRWGWKQDPNVLFGEQESWVLYVDLPQGQVSFHNRVKYAGQIYPSEWDGFRASCDRILAFCDWVKANAREDSGQLTFTGVQ